MQHLAPCFDRAFLHDLSLSSPINFTVVRALSFAVSLHLDFGIINTGWIGLLGTKPYGNDVFNRWCDLACSSLRFSSIKNPFLSFSFWCLMQLNFSPVGSTKCKPHSIFHFYWCIDTYIPIYTYVFMNWILSVIPPPSFFPPSIHIYCINFISQPWISLCHWKKNLFHQQRNAAVLAKRDFFPIKKRHFPGKCFLWERFQ